MEAIIPLIKEIYLRKNPEDKFENILDSEGHFWEDAIYSTGGYGDVDVEHVKIRPRQKKENPILHYNPILEFGRTKVGGIEYFGLPAEFFNLKKIDPKVFVPEFINAYKLASLAPKAIIKSGGVQTNAFNGQFWSCDLPFGVNVVIGEDSVSLRKIPSEADEAAKKAKEAAEKVNQMNAAKKALN
jgi:hypothetical protein